MKGNDMAQNIHANHVLVYNEHHAFTALKELFDAGDRDRAAKLSKILLAQGILIAGSRSSSGGVRRPRLRAVLNPGGIRIASNGSGNRFPEPFFQFVFLCAP